MGNKKVVKEQIEATNKQAGGATLTKSGRNYTLGHVYRTLHKDLNIQVKSAKHLKTQHIQKYVTHELEQGKSIRTIQDKLSHIRTALRAENRGTFADQLKNATLIGSKASRDGTHRALSQKQYEAALGASKGLDEGFHACLQLQRELGLRMREAIQSVDYLKIWEKKLSKGEKIRVVAGTKGGRARDTAALDPKRALKAVKTALEATKTSGKWLIRSSTLQGAARAYGRFCKAVGLTGEYASHALRCNYARDRYEQHLAYYDGNRKLALAETSLDLGHGDSRGRYVAQVYLKNAPIED